MSIIQHLNIYTRLSKENKMSKDMKLIMERWDKFIIEEEFEACADTNLSVGEFLEAIEIAIDDPKIRKE